MPSMRTDVLHCVHVYKDAMLGHFYAICNCCSCCCGAMQSFQNGTPMLASSGYLPQVDVDLCAGCGTCADHCQFAAISVNDGFALIDAAACMRCGVCVAHCPQEAISLLLDPNRGRAAGDSKAHRRCSDDCPELTRSYPKSGASLRVRGADTTPTK